MKRCPRPCLRAWPRGFTLVELLVVLALLALLAGLSWRGLDGLMRAQQQSAARSEAVSALQQGLAQWGVDLDALSPVPQTQTLDWNGRVLRLTRRASPEASAGASSEVSAGLRVVAWTVRGEPGAAYWLRWSSPLITTREQWREAWAQAEQWARNPDARLRQNEQRIAPVDNWQVFYFRGNGWSNPQSSAARDSGLPGGLSATPLPNGVRAVLELAPGHPLAGTLTRDWARPALGGNL